MTVTITDISALPEAAAAVIEAIGERKVVLLDAPMGAGKTTLIAAMCRLLGVEEGEVASPTFAIINEYASASGPVYHFDLYRLEDLSQALDIGMEDYLASGRLCLVEWPDVADALYPADAVSVSISVADDGSRTITVT